MTQLRDDCFSTDAPLLSTAAALELMRERLAPVVGVERVTLRQASGRILAEDMTADRDVPAHDNSAVDGFAFAHADLCPGEATTLPIAGRAAAGHPLLTGHRRGTAVRIFTGAMMPEGCDSVTMQEDCEVAGDRVVIPTGLRAGSNRRRRGEDIAAGRQVLSRGSWLRPQDVGLAASLGSTTLCVYRRLRVALFSTGDEIREPGAPIGAGQAYDANRFALGALIEGLGAAVDDLGIVPDRPEALRALLAQAAGDHDLIIGSGGVSVGEEDHVRDVIRALGSLHFWRLAIKPGRPLALGQVAGTPFVALPGNPVAVMVTFFRFVRPLALRLAGAKDVDPRLFPVTADFAYRKKPGRREWLRVRLAADPGGGWLARPFPRDGAGILSSLVESDGLLELPEELTELAPGGRVDFLPFSEVSR